MYKSQFFNVADAGDGKATIFLYGEVGGWEDIDSGRVSQELLMLSQHYKQIDIRINSVGGEVFAGIAIYNAIKASTADIRIYIEGLAASIAGVIALCGKPLYMSRFARLMLHNVSGGAWGGAKELRKTAEFIDSLQKSLAEMIAQRCGLTPEEVEQRYFADEQDHWFSATEAQALGLIDGIYDLEDTPEGLSPTSSNDDIYKGFNNRLAGRQASNQENMLVDEMKKRPAFANMTEAGMLAHIDSLLQRDSENSSRIAELEAQLAEVETRELEGIVDRAVADGKITAAQKSHFLALLVSNKESALALLEGMPAAKATPKPRASQYIHEGAPATNAFSGKSWSELDREGKLGAYKAQDPEGFKALYRDTFDKEYND